MQIVMFASSNPSKYESGKLGSSQNPTQDPTPNRLGVGPSLETPLLAQVSAGSVGKVSLDIGVCVPLYVGVMLGMSSYAGERTAACTVPCGIEYTGRGELRTPFLCVAGRL